jgi:hypothetical protein
MCSNSVMVYLGNLNAHNLLPNRKLNPNPFFINALDFNTPKDLAKYLIKLTTNKNKYIEFFKWRKQELSKGFENYFKYNFRKPGNESWICRICEYYHKYYDFEDDY